jgi:diguanylate cyclase (GGDEF)-like protein
MAEPIQDPHDIFSLTQIRHLMRVEFSRAQRYEYPVSCLVISLDAASRLRAEQGYAAKGKIMDAVVQLVLGATRTCDYVGRLLDDRLLAILPHTRREGAEVTAGRIVASGRSVKVAGEKQPVKTSLSIGISQYDKENTMFFDDLVDAAERALHEAVGEGGNRFVYREPGPGARTPPG